MRQNMRLLAAGAILAASLAAGGCLSKETSHTLVLEPDGSFRWAVLEYNVHSVGGSPDDSLKEERDFASSVEGQQNKAAIAFRALGGTEVRASVVDGNWPMTVRTEGQFQDIAKAWQRYFDLDGVSAQSTLTSNGEQTTWTLVIDSSQEVDSSESDTKSALESLLEDETRLALFMRHGKFVAATGFDLNDEGQVARMDDLSKHDWHKEPKLTVSLTWVAQ